MQLDKLRIELRPRPHSQGLDLGFALLHGFGGDVYRAWLALWLPAVAVSLLLTLWLPSLTTLWLMLPWWLRPLFERAPLYVLSRQVFGEQVGWRAALRAWPRQLGGGWFRMLTWWRPFMPGRGLHQPVWQLEQARGATATARRRVIARNGTGTAAYLFGTCCGIFESVLILGIFGFASLLLPDNENMNPFALFTPAHQALSNYLTIIASGIAGAIVGPIYCACCFTLYLNRRATLEAWDIELVLRQLRPPVRRGGGVRPAAVWLLVPLLALVLGAAPPPLQAANPAIVCPAVPANPSAVARSPDHDAAQAQLRSAVQQTLTHADLRTAVCELEWQRRDPAAEKAKPKKNEGQSREAIPTWAPFVALGFKWLLIGSGIALVIWLLLRYAPAMQGWRSSAAPRPVTEVAGLDIRAESLPQDVPSAVRALWSQGERRAALALLYRAALSHLVHQEGLQLSQGATEGDCLTLAQQAHAAGRLSAQRLAYMADTTKLWLQAAYGNRWPNDQQVEQLCANWRAA
jgi:hypothetical protein